MSRSQRIADNETSRYRFARSDVFAVLLLIGWCALGIVKIAHDVRDYRAQQAAIAELATRYPKASLHLFSQPGTPIAKVPYDPASEQWLLGEVIGYLLTLVVVAAGCTRARRRRVKVEVKWVRSTSRAATRRAKPLSPPRAAPGNVAADRLSAIVWSDRVVRREKEIA